MIHVIKILTKIVNGIHDLLIFIFASLGFQVTDKQLHFWVIGLIGIVSFFIVQALFRWLSKWNITVISFIYTFTLLIIFVFAIEIEQKITGRGSMEFDDAIDGLLGFMLLFFIYAVLRLVIYLIRRGIQKRKGHTEE